MSNDQNTPVSGPTSAVPVPVPGPRPTDRTDEASRESTSLEVLETLAELPVAEHLALFEQLQASLAADLDSTAQEHP